LGKLCFELFTIRLWDLQPEIATICRDTFAHLNGGELPDLFAQSGPITLIRRATNGDLLRVCDDVRESRNACRVFVKVLVELGGGLEKAQSSRDAKTIS